MFNFSSEREVPLLYGDLIRYLIFAITPRRIHRLGSIFNMMRISSRATKCTKGVFFCSAVFEKLARTHTPILSNWCPVPLVYLHVTPSKLVVLDSIVSSLDCSDNEDCPHIYFTGGYNEWLLVIVEKQDTKWNILVILYGTFMLEYLLVE